ncbi:hypothetical protein A9Q99_24500 [Gammaproteobacteria bacterium 45_16_T64]|nr:hypothetical protein A9Q99_24500 [Gammaproteobacteria bacterium 45_16_T64]
MRKRNPFKITSLAAAVSIGSLMAGGAQALDFTDGEFEVTLDTTLSVGAGWRISDIDYEGVGPHNAAAAGESDSHKHDTTSQDNSNLRYEQGDTYTEIAKAIIDLEINYKNFGAFFRAKGWYDYRLATGDGGSDLPAYYPTDPDGSPSEPRESDGHATEILDAFIWGDWWIGEMPLNVRYGRQVISWGEGVFFPNGINTINAIDVNALLSPGAELKEALLPAEALFASIGVTENLSFEAFVQFSWEETRVPACGTYFSTTDLIGDGCDGGFYIQAEAGTLPPVSDAPSALTRLPRGADEEASEDGQYGFATRYFIEAIETEVAFYFINYHSKLPLLSGRTPTGDADEIAAVIGGSIAAAAGAGAGLVAQATTQTSILSNDLTGIRDWLFNVAGQPTAMALFLPYSEYFVEYPEDIQLYGFSFSTTLDLGLPGGASSVAGEISMRQDQPLQIEDGVLLGGMLGFPSALCADSPVANDCFSEYGTGDYVKGYIEEDYYQAEFSMIHFFDRLLGAERWTFVADMAFSYIPGMPDEDELTLNSGYNAALLTPDFPDATFKAALSAALASEDEFYPTDFAWGYKLRASGQYSNVFAGINLIPTISFSHDVEGVTPSPISNFLEDRMSFSASVEAVYQNTYSVAASYTDFFGAEPYNQLADRDYFTLSASVSF